MIKEKFTLKRVQNPWKGKTIVIIATIVFISISLVSTKTFSNNYQDSYSTISKIPPLNGQINIETPKTDFTITNRIRGLIGDMDGDGLTDSDEALYKTNPMIPDTDYDGLLDGEEVHIYNTLPTQVDSDFDFICDTIEIFNTFTNPCDADCDNDGLLDGYEIITFKSNPYDPDTDDDGLTDYEEAFIYRTFIKIADSDSDGLFDGDEVIIYKTDPMNADTDGDRLSDAWEIDHNHNPLVMDNINKNITLYVVFPGIGLALVLAVIFASVAIQRNQLQYLTVNEQQLVDTNKKKLYYLLSSIPDNRQFSVQEAAEKIGCSVEELSRLLSSLFSDTQNNGFDIEECTIKTNTDKNIKEFHCFYCGAIIDKSFTECPICLQEVVRCKICGKALDFEETFTACATYGVIGKEDGISGFITIDHLCEMCMLDSKYRFV